jgi:uncharacterized protein YqgV (UPF0045/DUF77 family)
MLSDRVGSHSASMPVDMSAINAKEKTILHGLLSRIGVTMRVREETDYERQLREKLKSVDEADEDSFEDESSSDY